MAVKLIKFDTDINESDILKGLNREQKEAVSHIRGPLLVIAGAGSGKTRVLTHRIAYMIEKGIPPYSILALTFTNKAADEMKERIGKIVSPEAAAMIWAGTFHSIFARILRREAEKLGYTSSFSIYDADDSLSAVKAVMASMGISPSQYSPQTFRSRISWAKNQMISWQNFSNSIKSTDDRIAADVYKEYEDRLRSNNAMDFDDLLLNFIALLNFSADTLEFYQNRFENILVDEYQDTNRAQYIAIQLLAAKKRNLCVVGDDAQSIYRWRGADIRNILDFQKDYTEAKAIRLEQNYRSTKNILAAAANVIRNNQRQIQKKLWTDNEEGEKIEVLTCDNEYDEAEKIAKSIRKRILAGEPYNNFSVLYRTNAQALVIENSLRQYDLPYIIVGGIAFYQRKEIKDVLAYLRLLANPRDAEALLRVVNEPPRGIGNVSLNHIKSFASDRNVSLIDAFGMVNEVSELQQRAVNAVSKFSDFIKEFRVRAENEQLKDLIRIYIEATGLLQMYKEMNTEDALDRWNNIGAFISNIENYFLTNPTASLVDYLQKISLVSDIDEKDISGNKIALMTLHSAKGLEFNTVFIAGLEHGLFPFAKSEDNPEEIEEERRLFYVGITRARMKLFLTYALKRSRFGETTNQKPSHFLKELDKNLLLINGRQESAPKNNGNIYQPQKKSAPVFDDIPKHESYSQIPEYGNDLRVGDRVRHGKFGKGKILGISGEGLSRQALVNFESVGRKRLIMQYANLQKL
ncbi:MAG: ATP-dependent helicase UvrD/PcrA [Bacteroidota bacterium]|nr:ATP-dependent helicase UvrD/PcrA [Bacteroidota bacterium]